MICLSVSAGYSAAVDPIFRRAVAADPRPDEMPAPEPPVPLRRQHEQQQQHPESVHRICDAARAGYLYRKQRQEREEAAELERQQHLAQWLPSSARHGYQMGHPVGPSRPVATLQENPVAPDGEPILVYRMGGLGQNMASEMANPMYQQPQPPAKRSFESAWGTSWSQRQRLDPSEERAMVQYQAMQPPPAMHRPPPTLQAMHPPPPMYPAPAAVHHGAAFVVPVGYSNNGMQGKMRTVSNDPRRDPAAPMSSMRRPATGPPSESFEFHPNVEFEQFETDSLLVGGCHSVTPYSVQSLGGREIHDGQLHGQYVLLQQLPPAAGPMPDPTSIPAGMRPHGGYSESPQEVARLHNAVPTEPMVWHLEAALPRNQSAAGGFARFRAAAMYPSIAAEAGQQSHHDVPTPESGFRIEEIESDSFSHFGPMPYEGNDGVGAQSGSKSHGESLLGHPPEDYIERTDQPGNQQFDCHEVWNHDANQFELGEDFDVASAVSALQTSVDPVDLASDQCPFLLTQEGQFNEQDAAQGQSVGRSLGQQDRERIPSPHQPPSTQLSRALTGVDIAEQTRPSPLDPPCLDKAQIVQGAASLKVAREQSHPPPPRNRSSESWRLHQTYPSDHEPSKDPSLPNLVYYNEDVATDMAGAPVLPNDHSDEVPLPQLHGESSPSSSSDSTLDFRGRTSLWG
jgi:hypothetical protein